MIGHLSKNYKDYKFLLFPLCPSDQQQWFFFLQWDLFGFDFFGNLFIFLCNRKGIWILRYNKIRFLFPLYLFHEKSIIVVAVAGPFILTRQGKAREKLSQGRCFCRSHFEIWNPQHNWNIAGWIGLNNLLKKKNNNNP